MKRNDSPDFVGLEELKRKQREQLYNFECWAASGKWNEFHRHHYDWWMFPYNQPSSYGEAYTVYDYEVNLLKKDFCTPLSARSGITSVIVGMEIERSQDGG